ncbi:MAG TPA: hypothetical protein VLT90_12910 [Terriglobales bacterium]|nr:hypothetical protein [Terriglobales bacterium]
MFRPDPLAGVGAYKTYGLVRPLATHWRRATCEEVECSAFLHGWITRVPRGSEQAQYVLSKAHGRTFTETAGLDSTEHEFLFGPGQTCFGSADHKVPIEREPIYIVRDGDWRGNPTGWRREHKNGDDWVEDFGEHQDVLAARINRG